MTPVPGRGCADCSFPRNTTFISAVRGSCLPSIHIAPLSDPFCPPRHPLLVFYTTGTLRYLSSHGWPSKYDVVEQEGPASGTACCCGRDFNMCLLRRGLRSLLLWERLQPVPAAPQVSPALIYPDACLNVPGRRFSFGSLCVCSSFLLPRSCCCLISACRTCL